MVSSQSSLFLLCLANLVFFPLLSLAQADTTCSVSKPCYQGCCSKEGSCGFVSFRYRLRSSVDTL
jgi:hypothetical protein